VTSAAALVREARAGAGLSRSALAARTGVPVSTVSRIEDGVVDPTVTMLQRLMAAVGRQLELAAPELSDDLAIAHLVDAWTPNAEDDIDAVDWVALRTFLRRLERRSADDVAMAIATPPPRTRSPFFDNLLAAIAERCADEAGIARPRWCAAVPGLATPWRAPGTPRMVRAAVAATPEPFATRNLFLDESSLWHAHA